MSYTDSTEFVQIETELDTLNILINHEKNDNSQDLNIRDLLSILRVHNIVIGNFICNIMPYNESESNFDIMPGYDLAYDLFEKIGKNLNEYRSVGRSEESVFEELFGCLVTYTEMSAICGRHGWSDVNKRAAGLMSHLLIRYDYLVERLEEIIEEGGWTNQFSPTYLVIHNKIAPEWVSEFLNAVLKEYKEHDK